MLKITKVSENRVDVTLKGQLDADGMRTALDELIAYSENMQNGKMLYTIADFSWPGFAAIGVEMARLPKLFGLLSKIDKCAVVSDAGWIRNAAEFEGILLPGLVIKSFEGHETDAAEAWLSDA